MYSPQLQTQYILIRRKQHAPAHHRPPQNVWGGESFKINDLTPPPPTRLVGVQYTDFKGKNGNIGGKLHIDPPSPLSASGTGGGVVLWCPPPKTAFYVMKTVYWTPTELYGALWWGCGAPRPIYRRSFYYRDPYPSVQRILVHSQAAWK